MPLRVAFDLDGVLADMDGELSVLADRLFDRQETPIGPNPPGLAEDDSDPGLPEAPDLGRLELSARQQRVLWRHVETVENFWETLPEAERGAVARLASIAEQQRWEVIFLTKRPASAGVTSQVQTQRWLEARGFRLPSVYVVQGSRGAIAVALDLDVVVDDRLENCIDVASESRARAILVWRASAGAVPAAARRMGIGVVQSVDDCLSILAQATASPQGRPSFIARITRVLGIARVK